MDQVKGLSFFIDTGPGLDKVREFDLAIARITKALEGVGGAVDKADAAIVKFGQGTAAIDAAMTKAGQSTAAVVTPVRETAAATADLITKMKGALPAILNVDRGLGTVAKSSAATTTAQRLLTESSRATGAALALLSQTGAAAGMGRIATATTSAGVALRGFGALAAANPLGAIASAATVAASAFFLLGTDTNKASGAFEEYTDRAREAEAVTRRLADARRAFAAGETGSASKLLDDQVRQLRELQELQRSGLREVPLESLLAAIEPQARGLVGNLRAVSREMLRLGEDGEAASGRLATRFAELSAELRDRFGVQIRRVGDDVSSVFSGTRATAAKAFLVPLGDTIRVASGYVDQLADSAGFAEKKLRSTAAALDTLRKGPLPVEDDDRRGGDRRQSAAVADLIAKRQQEADLLGKSEEMQRRGKLLQEASNAAARERRDLRFDELVALELIARKEDQAANAATAAKRAGAAQDILDGLKNQIAALSEVGAARAALAKEHQVLAAFDKLEIAATDEKRQEAEKLLGVLRELLIVDEQRSRAARGGDARDRRYESALLQLQQEEKLLGLVGSARQKYVALIEAENAARQAGLEIGSDEYQDYVRRRLALSRLADVQERVAATFSQIGDSGVTALERVAIDGEKARDVMEALFRDLQRFALRQTAGAGLQQILTAAGAAVAGLFTTGTPTAGPDSPTGRAGLVNSSTPGGGNNYLGRLSGGLIPAMAGVVIDEFSFLRRGDKTYSVAEGGATTPEAVFRLAKDSKGNLGVTAVGGGGGGGDTYNMSFPSVRNAQDARATRMTMSQRVRALRAADRSGRVGLRPPGS